MESSSSLPRVSPFHGNPSGNRLLQRLSDDDLHQLLPHLKTVALEPKQVLHKQGEPLRYVYFPYGGVVSMATLLEDGGIIEAATIGHEGMVGIEAVFADNARSSCETRVQVAVHRGSAGRLSVPEFRRLLAVAPTLQQGMTEYVDVVLRILSRLMACNARHSVQQRCARWLLTTDDRLGGREFPISHELLAAILGVRRQSVSVAAGALRTAGFIRYIHGRVTILDRRGLETAACECYGVTRALYQRIKI